VPVEKATNISYNILMCTHEVHVPPASILFDCQQGIAKFREELAKWSIAVPNDRPQEIDKVRLITDCRWLNRAENWEQLQQALHAADTLVLLMLTRRQFNKKLLFTPQNYIDLEVKLPRAMGIVSELMMTGEIFNLMVADPPRVSLLKDDKHGVRVAIGDGNHRAGVSLVQRHSIAAQIVDRSIDQPLFGFNIITQKIDQELIKIVE
jgi:hypothetical protein